MKAFLWGALNFLQWLLVAVWTVVWTSVAIVAVALTRRKEVGLALARRIWAPVILEIGFVGVEIRGLERLDPRRHWFFASNHQSFIDIPVLFRLLPFPLRFVAKRELRKVPFMGWYMEAMGMVFVDRQRRTSGAAGIDAVTVLLREGASVLSFPAGTRRRPDEPQGWKAAAFAPALAAGVPVVPVAVLGTQDLLERGFRLRPGHARVAVGQPIETAGLPLTARDEIARRAEAQVVEMLDRLRHEAMTMAGDTFAETRRTSAG
jgi:1-acyl-sn-glycerol-3-phosphate acyltransferase